MGTQTSNVLIALAGVLVLGIVGFIVALRAIRRDEARRRSGQTQK